VRDPLITVALPVRNAATTVRDAIASIQWQTHVRWELIIADDGSTDGTTEICSQVARHDERVQVLHDGGRRGIAARLNEIAEHARGELMARMDGDDLAYPRRLEAQAAYLARQPEVDLVGSAMLVFRSDGTALGVRRGPATHDKICQHPEWGFRMFHPTWLGRVGWFRRYGYRVSGGEDQELLLRAHRESRYGNLPDVLLGYRQDHVPLDRLLRNRVLFARRAGRMLRQEGRGDRAASAALKQLVFGVGDAVAVGLRLDDRILRQRFQPASEAELRDWADVWMNLHGAVAHDGR
jgi:glycosyltransferase involved in cell wall biosynthesis